MIDVLPVYAVGKGFAILLDIFIWAPRLFRFENLGSPSSGKNVVT
jgi:hypothetical protein